MIENNVKKIAGTVCLYKTVKRHFEPCSYHEYDQSEFAKKYFDLTNRCAQNYSEYRSLRDLSSCYLYGIGTEIDEKKFIEFYRTANASRYCDGKSFYDTLKDIIKGTVQVGDEIVNYDITFWSRDSIKYWGSTNKNYIDLYTYKDLSQDDLQDIATDYLKYYRAQQKSS